MSLINLTAKHGQTLDEAQANLEKAVGEVQAQLGQLVKKVEWTTTPKVAKLSGMGFEVEVWVDAQDVHVKGEVPLFAALFEGPLKKILAKTFPKQLT